MLINYRNLERSGLSPHHSKQILNFVNNIIYQGRKYATYNQSLTGLVLFCSNHKRMFDFLLTIPNECSILTIKKTYKDPSGSYKRCWRTSDQTGLLGQSVERLTFIIHNCKCISSVSAYFPIAIISITAYGELF